MYATQLAGVASYRRDLGEPWTVARVFWSTLSKSRMMAGIQALRDAGDFETFQGFDPDGPLSSLLSDDADIAVEIDGRPWVSLKISAMRPLKNRRLISICQSLSCACRNPWAQNKSSSLAANT